MTIGMKELEVANGRLFGALDDILGRVDGTSRRNGAVESAHHSVSADTCSRLGAPGIPLRATTVIVTLASQRTSV